MKTNGDGNLFFTFIFPVTSKKQATCPTQLSGARKVLEPSRFLSPAHSRKKKKNHINWATEAKSVHNGLLLSDYCVQDVLKSSPGLSPFISQGREGRTKQEDEETEAQ